MRRIILLLTLFTATFAAAQPSCQTWSPECVLQIKRIEAVLVSPHHQNTMFLVKKANLVLGRWESMLYIVDNSHRDVLYVATQMTDLDKPSWSSKGDRIWFLAKGEKHRALWQLQLATLTMTKQLEVKKNIDSFAVAPDDNTLAYTTEITAPKAYPLVDRYGLSAPKGLWITSLDGKSKSKLITDWHKNVGARDDGLLTWSKDSQDVSFTYSVLDINDSYAQSWISHVAIANKIRGKTTDLVHADSLNTSAKFSHDGRWIAYNSNASALARHDVKQFFFSQICVVAVDGSKRKCLAETYDRRPELLGWSDDDQSVIVQEHRGIQNKLYQLPIDGGAANPILPENTQINPNATLNPTGDYLGFIDQQFSAPPEAYISTLKPFHPQQISHVQPKITAKLGQTKLIEWRAKDGKIIQGILITPTDYQQGQLLPLVLTIHGGPTNAWHEEFLGSAEAQAIPISFGLLANKGYAVLAVNIRGSTGYGPEFAKSNFQDLGGKDFQDALAGVDHLVQEKIADPKRLAIWGWSYGGYMSAWAITQTPRFKAAVVGAGLTDLISFDGTSVLAQVYLPSYVDKYFWQDKTFYLNRSPIMFANQITTPTLIQYGAEDHIVPPTQGAELFNALNIRKIPVAMFIFPGEGHSFTNPKMMVIGLQQLLDWLHTHL